MASLPLNQKIMIILFGCAFLFMVIELVRRRKMMEQYSALWLIIGVGCLSILWTFPLIVWFTDLIGAGFTTSTILFIGFLMLLLINLQLTLKISDFSFKIKDLVQEHALLTDELNQLKSDLEDRKETQTKLNKPAGSIVSMKRKKRFSIK